MLEGPLRWRHVIINTHSSWLHGSPRGFRSWKHRIHSSGDYKNPPPPGEHSGLLRYHVERSSPKVEIPEPLRGIVGAALVTCLLDAKRKVLSASVADLHAHFLAELPEDLGSVKQIVGRAKEKASRVANNHVEGFRWSAGGTYKLITNDGHLQEAFGYVLARQGADAWRWCHQCGAPCADQRCPLTHP
jgi:hypothetical protein